MSTVTPTLIPRLPAIPVFLPKMPTPHPTSLPPQPTDGGLHERRNLRAEMEELSEEEEEIETHWKDAVQARGFAHLRVIGRLLTRQEEKNDAETDSDESGSADQMSVANDGENPSEQEQEAEDQEQDLDASMEDLDEEGRNGTFDVSEGDVEDLEADDEGDTEL